MKKTVKSVVRVTQQTLWGMLKISKTLLEIAGSVKDIVLKLK